MSREEQVMRAGFGVLTESAPPAPSSDEIGDQPKPRPLWRLSYAVAVAGLAALVFVSTSLFGGGMRMAYAMDSGLDLTYTVNSRSTVHGETFAFAPAEVRYQLSDAGDGLIDVHVSYEFLEDCDIECWPDGAFTQTVTENGEIVAIRGMSQGQGVPGFVIPNPIVASGVSGVRGNFPLALGPPLPDRAVGLGDTWETSENDVAGQHRLVGQTQLGDRDVVIIESTYSYISDFPEVDEEITATTTVWFDPADGIVVQALLTRSSQSGQSVERMDLKLNE